MNTMTLVKSKFLLHLTIQIQWTNKTLLVTDLQSFASAISIWLWDILAQKQSIFIFFFFYMPTSLHIFFAWRRSVINKCISNILVMHLYDKYAWIYLLRNVHDYQYRRNPHLCWFFCFHISSVSSLNSHINFLSLFATD